MALDVCQNWSSKIYWWVSCILTVALYFDSRLLCHFECVAILRPFSFCVCALILNAFSFWVCSHLECVLILSVFSFWMCFHFQCVLILNAFSFWMCSHFECVLILNAFLFWTCSHFECVLILSVFSFWMCSHFECVLILNAFSFWVCSHFECVVILNAFSFWTCSHFQCVLIFSVLAFWQYPKTPCAPYSISFPTLRTGKQDGASQLTRTCRCTRKHTKVFDQRDMAVTISRCKWRNNRLFDTSIGATLTTFVANNGNCEYGHVRTNSSGRRDTLSKCNNCIFQPAF